MSTIIKFIPIFFPQIKRDYPILLYFAFAIIVPWFFILTNLIKYYIIPAGINLLSIFF